MRQRAFLGLVFVAASALLAWTVAAGGGTAGVLTVLLVLVLLVQASLLGSASKDLRRRFTLLVALGLVLFAAQVVVRVTKILQA